MSQDQTNDSDAVIPYKIYGFEGNAFQICNNKIPNNGCNGKQHAANGDLAVAAFITVTSVIRTPRYACSRSVSAARKVTAAGQLFMIVPKKTKKQKTSRYIMGSEERVGVFSHFAHSCSEEKKNKKQAQGVASH